MTPPLDRLKRYFATSRAYMSERDHAAGCLIGNLGQEMAGQSVRFREALNHAFLRWEARFAHCLQTAQAQGALTQALGPSSVGKLHSFRLGRGNFACQDAEVRRRHGSAEKLLLEQVLT